MSEHTLVSEQTLTLLLRGEWICLIRYPDAYRFLADESKRRDTESFLARLGRRLSCTRQGGAWFAAYIQIGPEERRAIREHFAVLKHDLRPLVDFFNLVMRAQRQDEFLAPGTVIESHALMAAIDGNLSLTTELKALAGYGKGTIGEGTRSILDRLLRKLLDDGYLTLSNPERHIYKVTGKIEYFQAAIDFLMEHECVPEEIEEDANPEGQQELPL